MVKLDVSLMRFLEEEDYRCLTALEMSMRNHEVAPTALIERIAGLAHGGVKKRLKHLLKHKLIHHESKHYDGYCMKYQSYDFLALRTFSKRGTVTGVGSRVGCGKESDIIHVEDENGMEAILKLQRLGRCSFRSVARNRDYKNGKDRRGASWFYLSRLAAQKEFAFMKMLYDEGFPVPKPIDQNRHAVVMEYINGVLLNNIETMLEAQEVYERALKLMVKLAEHGLIHGDFNEFNILITEDLKVIMIDFPQMISTDHPNAEELFDRDVKNLTDFFVRRFRIPTPYYPKLQTDIKRVADLDRVAMASGHFTKRMQAEMEKLLLEQSRKAPNEMGGSDDDDESEEEESDNEMPEDDRKDLKLSAEEKAAAKARRHAAIAKLEKPSGAVDEGAESDLNAEEDEAEEGEEDGDDEEPKFQKQKKLTKQEEKALQAAQPRPPRKIKIVSRSRNGVTTVGTVDAADIILPSKPISASAKANAGEGEDETQQQEAEGDELDNVDMMTTATEARTRLRTTAKVDLKEVSAKVKRIGIREDDREFSRNLHRNTQKGREKAKIKNQLKSAHGADFF